MGTPESSSVRLGISALVQIGEDLRLHCEEKVL